jgi:transcriptional regulator with XRE-family HTH domain
LKKCEKRTWLIERRKAAGYESMRGFAREIGISPSYYCEIETGVKNPGGRAAYKISQALSFNMSIFFDHIVQFEQTKGA